ncbi:hypothetical protein [Methylobacterium sp. Leaf106]|nr:hypothetical protein [Methylobacterium sp. Leaf106]
MSSGITLSAATRQNLPSLHDTAALVATNTALQSILTLLRRQRPNRS